jgi:hypothetical protein
MVEYAFAISVFLLLTIGVVDAARALWGYNTVAFLARDAARYGTVPTRSSTDVRSYVLGRCTSMVSNPCPAAPAFNVVVHRGTCGSTADLEKVTVSQQFVPVTPMVSHLWGSAALTLSAASSMYVEALPGGGCAS